MYYKDDLLAKDIRELVDIANEIGADATISDKEALVYDILEKQATAEAAKNPLGQKRKRTRIIKKDTDHVYSVNGKEGENFDTKKNKNATSDPLPLFKAVAEGAQKPAIAEAEPAEAEIPEASNIPAAEENNEAPFDAQAEAQPTIEELEAELKALSKHRGRKSKRELELIAAIDALKASQQDGGDTTDDNADDD